MKFRIFKAQVQRFNELKTVISIILIKTTLHLMITNMMGNEVFIQQETVMKNSFKWVSLCLTF